MLDQELGKKYDQDPRFHNLVHHFLATSERAGINSLELQQISQVAVHILREEEVNSRRR